MSDPLTGSAILLGISTLFFTLTFWLGNRKDILISQLLASRVIKLETDISQIDKLLTGNVSTTAKHSIDIQGIETQLRIIKAEIPLLKTTVSKGTKSLFETKPKIPDHYTPENFLKNKKIVKRSKTKKEKAHAIR